jgi:CrcB protein
LKRYIFIAVGGVLGAMLRYFIKSISIDSYTGIIPINVLVINIIGSFLLALLLTTALVVKNFNEDIRIGIGTGFLGAFTTFSTMCKEAVTLMRAGHFYSSVLYLGLSTILGLIAAYFGVLIVRKVKGVR